MSPGPSLRTIPAKFPETRAGRLSPGPDGYNLLHFNPFETIFKPPGHPVDVNFLRPAGNRGNLSETCWVYVVRLERGGRRDAARRLSGGTSGRPLGKEVRSWRSV